MVERGAADSDANTDFMPQIKKRQQIRYAWSKARFTDTQEKATGHHPSPTVRASLRASNQPPTQDGEGQPHVRWYDLPHQRLEFEDDVGDVEDCQEPSVVVSDEMQIFGHTCNPRIANVGAVEEREHVESRDERDNPEIHLPDDSPLDAGLDMAAVSVGGSLNLIALLLEVQRWGCFSGSRKVGGCGGRSLGGCAQDAHVSDGSTQRAAKGRLLNLWQRKGTAWSFELVHADEKNRWRRAAGAAAAPLL